MLRRDFLRATVAAAAIAPCVGVREALGQEAPMPSVLWLRRGKDQARIDFATQEGYNAAAYLLRDAQANFVGRPHPALLRLLAWEQAWLAAYGYTIPFLIHSGCRLASTNSREGGALNSRHLPNDMGVFRAVDFSTREISAEYLGRLAYVASQGGVGFYSQRGFVHNDVDSRIRTWRGK
ncbi:D-Ala-D-Ala carboxypeptidase family metallohydrolase [Cupriavidus sp. L7L]|uniref:YcbK family protein n=1 Tax=Cupriavidus sp. L7L TaxID=2546443 RepID=UPI00105598E8|nr:D-Ala-D-Ala carboxypeptidase family metallohydrolase [Cupriavidus sp. L7L]TDF55929.1 DUF882 domain-containing protein [Cupriavidus sp. L7L]